MPSDWHIANVCARCCVWHKPGRKEEETCGGILAMEKFEPGRIPPAALGVEKYFENRFDNLLEELVCLRCPFLIDGCDFRDPEVTTPALPCGGYVHLDRLLTEGVINEELLRKALSDQAE